MFYEEVAASFNLENARINYGNGIIVNSALGMTWSNTQIENSLLNYLLISESSSNSVMLLNFNTGDLVNPDFIPPQSNLSLPKQARQSPRGTISISDQTEDVIFDYDTLGALIGIFAPSFGPHTGILDNVRGHDYKPYNKHLLVCNAQGGNFNRVVEFDSLGNYLGQFFPDNSGGLLGPFDVLVRTNDVLVTGSTSSAAHRYDLNGNYLDDFAGNILFPQQMVEFANSNVGIASFGSSGGLKIYDPNGTIVNEFNSVSGLRGVHYLGSGNIIVTNSGGVHEIDGTTGDFVRTIVAGVSAQYVNSCNFTLDFTPVELASFTASFNNNSVILNWITSSELNNSGFEIEKQVGSQQSAVSSFETICFVDGNGTTTETNYYSFIDEEISAGIYKYRLNQIDFDGTQEVVGELNVNLTLPERFSLDQNYPNPFNPSTTIRYSIPNSEFVTLKIYDVLGNEVATLVNEEKPAGSYEVEFSAKVGSASGGNAYNLSSGIYFYTLQAGSFTQTKKLILLR
jgi:hypothetical protein